MKSKKHLDYIRQLPCCCCLSDRSDRHRHAHHLLRVPERAGFRKVSDKYTIPLCTRCHTQLHKGGDETGFLAKHHIKYPVKLATTLLGADPDHAEGRRMIIRSKRP